MAINRMYAFPVYTKTHTDQVMKLYPWPKLRIDVGLVSWPRLAVKKLYDTLQKNPKIDTKVDPSKTSINSMLK